MKWRLNLGSLKKLKKHPGIQCLLIVIAMVIAPVLCSWILDISNEGAYIQPVASSRQDEYLNRGLVAIETLGGVYLGWRFLDQDPANITFDVYRQNNSEAPVKLNGAPISLTTDFNDTTAGTNVTGLTYWVNSSLGIPSENATIRNAVGTSYISIPISGNFTPERVGLGDLDGDGSLDFVIKQRNAEDEDYSSGDGPSPSTYKVQAYLSDGTFLWQNDLGWNIPLGSSSPFIVYDLNGDGKAEVAIKTSIGDNRDETGDVITGPEYLSVWDGLTGAEICKVDFIPRYSEDKWHPQSTICMAYLDGVSPYLVMSRGTYGYIKTTALRFHNSQLDKIWYWESTHEFGIDYFGQGSHWLRSVDVDYDGRDEIIVGSCVVDDTGKGLWSTRFRHADSAWVGEIDPNRAGLEIYYNIQGEPTSTLEVDYGLCAVDASTGLVTWAGNQTTRHVHSRGLVSDIDSRYPGMECYGGDEGTMNRWLFAPNGTLIGNGSGVLDYSLAPEAAFWDADLQREVIVHRKLYHFETETLEFTLDGDILAIGDIHGDWREEIITAKTNELRIYTTTILATDRRTSLLNDPIYRNDLAHCSMGYWQVPMMSTCLAVPSVSHDPSQPVVYNKPLNDKIQNAVFWVQLEAVINQFLWEFIIYCGIIALVSLIYLIAFLRRLALTRKAKQLKG
ncbi:MAG: silent information regulator protein Sir2 [Candidatus Hodarchaeota archaeon]